MTLSVMENQDAYRTALREYQSNLGEIPKILERYLDYVARTGKPLFSWELISELIIRKLQIIVENYDEKFNMYNGSVRINDLKEECVTILKQISGVPFTIQRICELLLYPKQYYAKVEKFLRGFLRVIKVVTIVDRKGEKITTESQKLANSLSPTLSGMGGLIDESGDVCYGNSSSGVCSNGIQSGMTGPDSVESGSNKMNEDDEGSDEMHTNTTNESSNSTVESDDAIKEIDCEHSYESNNDTNITDDKESSNPERPGEMMSSSESVVNLTHSSYLSSQQDNTHNQQSSIPMPPIRALLKPIDELEAFVQQVPTAPLTSNRAASSLNVPETNSSSEYHHQTLHSYEDDDGNESDELVDNNEDDELDHLPPIKRRKLLPSEEDNSNEAAKSQLDDSDEKSAQITSVEKQETSGNNEIESSKESEKKEENEVYTNDSDEKKEESSKESDEKSELKNE